MIKVSKFWLVRIFNHLPKSLIFCLIFISGMQQVKAADLVFNGGSLPSTQGWDAGTDFNLPPDVTTDGDALTINTIGKAPPNSLSGQFTLFSRNLGIDETSRYSINSIELTLKVLEVTEKHNTYDASVAFLPSYGDGGFSGSLLDREQMIYFDEDSIGWGDDTQSFVIDTTNDFHTYRLTIDNTGLAKLFVDNVFALQRSNFKTNGIIAFGDQTNDLNLESRFAVRSILVERTPLVPLPVPEPSTALSTFVMLGYGAFMRRQYLNRRRKS
ncbi:PEP-CTERM sorting domain-containing protein (plasmid) [Nostoc sp. C057]|uniref:PEP-CTERM sorting domain-containing protein n=1 Tax=Nostoc sp. C057 TaxID=2576903 RepID=UPI0015C3912E|nr:PEP-CTERM sorting domain-containing protein [Nostoc sp. C057]QLE53096.1 PEP-CTERM sorting domain-containing protein [Nostoc sp. C057]